MVNWLELIEEKEDQILAEGEKAYKEAINNPHLRYIVEQVKIKPVLKLK